MTAPTPRRGPLRLAPAAVEAFLGKSRLGSVCFEAVDGHLVAAPATIEGGIGESCVLRPVEVGTGDASRPAPGRPTCFVADEFESYEGIRGVIIQGRPLDPGGGSTPGEGRAGLPGRFEVTKVIGFTFAGTLPPPPPRAPSG